MAQTDTELAVETLDAARDELRLAIINTALRGAREVGADTLLELAQAYVVLGGDLELTPPPAPSPTPAELEALAVRLASHVWQAVNGAGGADALAQAQVAQTAVFDGLRALGVIA